VPTEEFEERNVHSLPSTGYDVGTWRDGLVGSGKPVNAVAFTFKMRAGDIASYLIAMKAQAQDEAKITVRLKSRKEVSRLMGLLARYADEVWPEAQP